MILFQQDELYLQFKYKLTVALVRDDYLQEIKLFISRPPMR